jgi:hypothetical protein
MAATQYQQQIVAACIRAADHEHNRCIVGIPEKYARRCLPAYGFEEQRGKF